MDLEKLKCCAKAGGLDCIEQETTFGSIALYCRYEGESGYYHIYDPEHNDAQAFELLKWLLEKSGYQHISIEKLEMIYLSVADIENEHWTQAKGQTLNQAVIEAVWEVKK